jgi:predicted PurR-regulated permease PerM
MRSYASAAAVFAVALLLWNVLSGALSALLLLFTAILVSSGLRPIVDRMSRRMPFGAAVSIAFGGVIVVVAAIGFVLVQPVGTELVKLIGSAPAYAHELQEHVAATQRFVESDATAKRLAGLVEGSAGAALALIGRDLLGGPAMIATAVGDALLILLLAVGWMLSSDELTAFVLSVIPPATRANWEGAFTDIGTRLSAYVEGVVLNGIVVGVAIGAGLALAGIPYAILLGVVAAIFQAIPMVGAVISGIIILLVVLATSGMTKMLIALAIFAVVQGVDQNVLSPIIFGQRVQLSFLLIIFATVVGGTLLGIGGAFLAVPMAAVVQVLVVRIVAPALRATH